MVEQHQFRGRESTEAARSGGYGETFDLYTYFLHDVPPEVAAEGEQHQRTEVDIVFGESCALTEWPNIPSMSSPVAMTASFRSTFSDESRASGSVSTPMSCRADTLSPCPIRANWPSNCSGICDSGARRLLLATDGATALTAGERGLIYLPAGDGVTLGG